MKEECNVCNIRDCNKFDKPQIIKLEQKGKLPCFKPIPHKNFKFAHLISRFTIGDVNTKALEFFIPWATLSLKNKH